MKKVLKMIAMFFVSTWAGFLRLFMTKEKRKYNRWKVNSRKNPETKARAVHIPLTK